MEKTCTKCGVIKSFSEFSPAKMNKGGVQSRCKMCRAAAQKAWREANPEKEREQAKARYEANRDKILEHHRVRRNANLEKAHERERLRREANPDKARKQARAWRDANPDKARKHARAWQKANPEKVREQNKALRAANPEKIREQTKAWRAANPDKVRSTSATRRAGKRKAQPTWVDRASLTAIFQWADDCQTLTGEPHHVDHICPLKAKVYDPDFDCYLPASGLHVPWNLDPKPAAHNRRKGNRATLDEILRTPSFIKR